MSRSPHPHSHTCTCGAKQVPPQLVSETDNWTRMLVKEMIAHKHEFERARDAAERSHELDSFWLRKSKQPVLSVLMVKKKNKGVRFFRGMNVEVSMPTGSLCSERNAIGSALSTDPTLCRKDLRMIAVLALGLEPFSTTSTLSAHMPVPPKLIPLAPTTPHSVIQSPTKTPYGGYPVAFPELDEETAAAMETEEKLPAQAVSPALLKAQSERSMFQHPGHKGSSGAAPPSSPRTRATPSPPVEMKDEKQSSSGATPRKRKSSALAAAAAAQDGASGTGTLTVHFAPGATTRSSTPPQHSPRFTRHSSAQDLSSRLSNSATAAAASSLSPPPPAIVSPVSPQRQTRSMRSGSNGTTAGAAVAVKAEPSAEPTRTSKRARRASMAADNGVTDSIYADGDVTEQQKADYLAHELALVAQRDAQLAARHASLAQAARMSGNLAPGAVTPMDRYPSASPPPPLQLQFSRSLSAGAALTVPGSSSHAHPSTHAVGSHAAHLAFPESSALPDERNPINPCGACNEWLKKIAESNPDFRVVTFTSTDCSTCFVKPVKD